MHVFSYPDITSQQYLTGSQYTSNENWLMEPILPAHCIVKRLSTKLEKSFVREIEEC